MNKALIEMVEQQPSTSTHILSATFSPIQSTINQYHNGVGSANRSCLQAYHERKNNQVEHDVRTFANTSKS